MIRKNGIGVMYKFVGKNTITPLKAFLNFKKYCSIVMHLFLVFYLTWIRLNILRY